MTISILSAFNLSAFDFKIDSKQTTIDPRARFRAGRVLTDWGRSDGVRWLSMQRSGSAEALH